MALLFCDGMDAYTKSSELTAKGWQGGTGSTVIDASIAFAAGAGAYGGGAIVIGPTDYNAGIYKPNLFTYAAGYTLNVGQYFKQSATPSAPTTQTNIGGVLMLGYDSNTSGSSDSYTVVTVNAAGKLVFYPFGSASGTPNATTGSVNVCDGVFHWIEIQLVLNTAATGSVKIYVDGVLDLSLNNIITVVSGNTPTGHVGFGTGSNNGTLTVTNWVDDFIVWDNTGTTYNTFPMGQKRIYTGVPNAAGSSAQYAPSAGANYAVAAQAYSASATLTATAASQLDLYGNTGLGGATPSEIDAVVINAYANNPANGTRKLMAALQSKGTTVTGSAQQLKAAFGTYQTPFYLDSSGAAWSSTTVAGMQIGMESA